ncbi:methyltransferase domain-containing protein [Paenibacillus dauci]|uniref:methyltransferase domain-containing protein n=1 Tax=Paenibacillus dauci TaxID=1567106 RepID=UPI0006190BEC|nr:methyltransferase domain-containing protein [Paenibacillus dauci]
MKINELARKLGITSRTIRFYEQHGLLEPARQQDNQYRVFVEEDIWRLQTIIALREAGMPLKDIRNVLEPTGLPDNERLRYYLELQHSLLTTQWLEMKRMTETTAQMIELLRSRQELPIGEIYQLADHSRKLREMRQNWQDHWDFDQRASNHDDYVQTETGEYPDYEKALDSTASAIQGIAAEHGLDLGTGTGNLAGRLLRRGIRMSGVDQSQEMLKQCRSKFPEMDLRIGNLLAIPYPDQYFDFVVSSFTLRHLSAEQQLLALPEIQRVLKPHGRICITDRTSILSDGNGSHAEFLLDWLNSHGFIATHLNPQDNWFTLLAISIR